MGGSLGKCKGVGCGRSATINYYVKEVRRKEIDDYKSKGGKRWVWGKEGTATEIKIRCDQRFPEKRPLKRGDPGR